MAAVNPEGLSHHLLLRIRHRRQLLRCGQNRQPRRRARAPRSPLARRSRDCSPTPPTTTAWSRPTPRGPPESPASFETTQGFGFLAGTAGFAARATADGGAAGDQGRRTPLPARFHRRPAPRRRIRRPARRPLPRRRHARPDDRDAAGDDRQPQRAGQVQPRPVLTSRAARPLKNRWRARAAPTAPRSARSRSRPASVAASPGASASSTSNPLPASPPSSASRPSARRSSSTAACARDRTAPTPSASRQPTFPSRSTSTASTSSSGAPPGAPPTTANGATA